MGMFKRILRQTSHKLLAKLGAPHSSHRLVLNASAGVGGGQQLACTTVKNRVARKMRRSKKRDSAVSEALLLAAKNFLPPVQFHHVHGPNVQLSSNKFVARRSQSFCQALVFSNRVILPNERVYIKVLEIAKGWSGTIRFGFTSVDPATLRYQMPKHACPDMTNAGHTWARALADEVVRRNSVIHFSYNTNGYIHYGINNQDCGVFNANVKTSQHLWFIVDIYGLTAAVELIDPRIHHNNSSIERNFTRLDQELRNDSRGTTTTTTMYKSTGAMDELMGSAFGVRAKKKRGRKSAAASSRHLLYGQWSSENLMMGPRPLNPMDESRATMLPNLSSIILPPTQQNIYSPMPSVALPRPLVNESHDYYQIMSSSRQPTSVVEQHASNPRQLVAANHSASYDNSLALDVSASSANTSVRATRYVDDNEDDDDEGHQEICQQLDNFQIDEQPRVRLAHPTYTTTNSSPIAAARRGTNNNSVQQQTRPPKDGHLKTAHSGTKGSSSKSCSASAEPKSKTRHSIKTPKATTTTTTSSRDNNNNSPVSKDCPICFERPINCVLYQCGHMCTCYECGVKQWKTQSRTCPICRTVIKDVIKTYMS